MKSESIVAACMHGAISHSVCVWQASRIGTSMDPTPDASLISHREENCPENSLYLYVNTHTHTL